jgi:hypothetical protein
VSRNLDTSARIVFILMGIFLVLFIISFILTTIGDDTVGANRVNDITAIAKEINAGNVTEINQRNGIQMIIFLKNGERLVFFRPANTAMTDLLQGAGVDPGTMNSLNFTAGEPPNTLTTVGNLLRLIGLAGLGVTAVLGYLQRRRMVLGSGRRLR